MKSGSFKKYGSAPVFGDTSTGTVFDAFVREDGGRLRMDFSWRPKAALAVTFSDDGISWEEPTITLECEPSSGWEQIINRNCVVKKPDGEGYLMWYTGQVWDGGHGVSKIGIARSADGVRFERFREGPVLVPEAEFEKESVMNPFVMFDGGRFRMWYAAGETYEPNVLCYAESADGIVWRKSDLNPILEKNPGKAYEQDRIGGCQVLPHSTLGYLVFYIGYRDVDTACVCAAYSENGTTDFHRCKLNPLIFPTPGGWDADACYKPSALYDPEKDRWRIWYNGRAGSKEYIGLAEKTGDFTKADFE